jgi:two-component sensor histidine kinase
MPNTATIKKARRDLAQGKSRSTAAGEFVREEMHHIRERKHRAKNAKQAIAIGLAQARRAGIMTKPGATASKKTKGKAARELSS